MLTLRVGDYIDLAKAKLEKPSQFFTISFSVKTPGAHETAQLVSTYADDVRFASRENP